MVLELSIFGCDVFQQICCCDRERKVVIDWLAHKRKPSFDYAMASERLRLLAERNFILTPYRADILTKLDYKQLWKPDLVKSLGHIQVGLFLAFAPFYLLSSVLL